MRSGTHRSSSTPSSIDQLDCAIDARGLDNCRTPDEGGRVWIMGEYGWADLDSNDNAIGYDGNHWAGTLGGEYRFGNFALGAFFGYRNVDVDFPDALVGSSDRRQAAGIWASPRAMTSATCYVRGIGSYSSLDGDSERDISIGTIVGSAAGDPDVNVWSFYGEGGYRFDLGEFVDHSVRCRRLHQHEAQVLHRRRRSREPTSTSTARPRASSPASWVSSGPAISAASFRKRSSPIVTTSAVTLASMPALPGAPAGADFTKEEDRNEGLDPRRPQRCRNVRVELLRPAWLPGAVRRDVEGPCGLRVADLHVRRSAATASASASAASAATSGDADLPGRLGDPGDGHLSASASAAAAAAAAAGTGAGLRSVAWV